MLHGLQRSLLNLPLGLCQRFLAAVLDITCALAPWLAKLAHLHVYLSTHALLAVGVCFGIWFNATPPVNLNCNGNDGLRDRTRAKIETSRP